LSYVRDLATEQKEQFLRDAAKELAWVTLATRMSNGWSNYKTRLLEVRTDPPVLMVEYPAGGAGQPAPDIAEGQLVGMTFRRGHRKCVFTSMVLGKQRVAMAEHTQLGALVLRWPAEMQELQRRAYRRVDVPIAWDIEVGFWPCETKLSPRKPPPPPLFTGVLVNLSAGGLAAIASTSDIPQDCVGAVYAGRFTLVKHHPPFMVQFRARHIEPTKTPGRVEVGCQFLGLEFSPRTLSRLTRVVTQFQRFTPGVYR